jgi:hypothetical protein
VAPPLLEPLRPKPFRGDVVAAGVVVLVTLVWVLEARFAGRWASGAHLAYAVLTWAFITTMAWLAPMERETPRAYQSVLYAGSFAVAAPALANLADALGADALGGAGAQTWALAALAMLALTFATHRNSAVSTLLGALSAGLAVLAAVEWIFDPGGARTLRWVALGLMVVYGLAALGQRDRRRRHAVALVDAAGLAGILIGLTLTPAIGSHLTFVLGSGARLDEIGTDGAATGWALLLAAAGFGLIAYSSVDREPGPAYLGVANLALFVGVVGRGNLLGWPLVLLVAAAALLAVGLRPTTPAPPPPDADGPPAAPLPLR